MWPWEHLAIGYLALSAWCRLSGKRPATDELIAIVFGSQFPDVVDKPLGWGTSLLPSGTSLAHSYLFAVPTVAVVVIVSRRHSRPAVGIAFAIGYLLHMPADAVYGLLTGGQVHANFMLWPLLPVPPAADTTILGRTAELFAKFVRMLGTPKGRRYLLLEAVLLGGALAVWLFDNKPGLDMTQPPRRNL